MQGLFRVLLYLHSYYVYVCLLWDLVLVMKKKKGRTLNSIVNDERNLLDAAVEHGVRKNEEKEFLLWQCIECCCKGILCRSLSLSLYFASRVSIHIEYITRRERRRVRSWTVCSFVHLSILYCFVLCSSPAVHACVYIFSLSPIRTHSYC